LVENILGGQWSRLTVTLSILWHIKVITYRIMTEIIYLHPGLYAGWHFGVFS